MCSEIMSSVENDKEETGLCLNNESVCTMQIIYSQIKAQFDWLLQCQIGWRLRGWWLQTRPCWCSSYLPPQLQEGNMKADLEASLPAGQEGHAIQCRDVCRSYGKLKVLSNLNLTVPQGQMWVKPQQVKITHSISISFGWMIWSLRVSAIR